jgi:hypothetical protein
MIGFTPRTRNRGLASGTVRGAWGFTLDVSRRFWTTLLVGTSSNPVSRSNSSGKEGVSEASDDCSDDSTGALGLTDAVEAALTFALTEATKVGKWDVVAQLARELEARRLARSNVVQVDARRARRGEG